MKKAFPLRISTELWGEIQRLAAADLRSVNAEIEFLLREAVARRRGRRPEMESDSRPDER
ncbi:MAG TPA: hypothetical protein VMX94_07805 [Armatimonadota bacterium]|nr:hypothetical protein [Armatimonadota bacterium]